MASPFKTVEFVISQFKGLPLVDQYVHSSFTAEAPEAKISMSNGNI